VPIRIDVVNDKFVVLVQGEPDYVVGMRQLSGRLEEFNSGKWLIRCIGVWSAPYRVEAEQDVALVKKHNGAYVLALYPYDTSKELSWLGAEAMGHAAMRMAVPIVNGVVMNTLRGTGEEIAGEVRQVFAPDS